LDERRSRLEEFDETFWRTYGGGGLLATCFLFREPRGVDSLDPSNPLLFASSVAAGHPYAGLARFTAASKSPLTGGIGETRCEGPFGIALKRSGADALIVHGASEKPVVLAVENGRATFHDGTDLWGKTVPQTADLLRERFGPDAHSAVIGPAGENRVRYASVVTDRTYAAGRMGMGAVMGSKRLKAVVLRGDDSPPAADPDGCAALTALYRERVARNPLTRWQLEPPGFSAWVHTHGLDSALCTRNYRDSLFEGTERYAPERFMSHYRGEAPCPGCPNQCMKIIGESAIHQEVAGAMGSNLGIADLTTVLRANDLCIELGLDPTSLGFTLSMAMECVEEGLLKEELRFGDGGATLAMVRRIASREGFGDVLAEGSARAAKTIGGDASRFALHVKGLEMVPFEPRTQTNLALGYAVSPVGPRYDICEHDWDYDTQVGWSHTLEHSKTLGILDRIPMEHLGIDKVSRFKELSNLWSGADVLGLCIFAIAPTRVFSLHEMAQLVAAVTGWDYSGYEIMRLGERRLHLMRAYNLREGLTAAEDTLPDRFFEEPIRSAGRWNGLKLDRAKFGECVQAYYRMMGWTERGSPRYETLLEHRLDWARVD
jgi:aldehyde:ferredoxin oxidoreductase